ncbi:tRNA (guanosine(46)-N7)-methyltransferase TrmB [Aerococcaceae bacterium DSM 111020]|nr:tRNA (guanosine(46)-N7)-methyltransferase TrmB [Aerococcaceae bacterium DSM 111020]
MRLRNKPWAAEKLKAYPQYVIWEDASVKGNWQTRFETEQPIHLEVGSGKGRFMVEMAKAHPNINYIAMELQTSVVVSILESQIEEKLPNLRILHGHGGDLDEYFEKGEVSRIYLNFSDPWPKKRHAKRRLTSPKFLTQYQQILPSDGDIHFKTDNMGLFEYSLATMSQFGMAFHQVWLDLHHSDFEDNIMTEYEEKFSSKGHPIYRLEAYFPK